MSSLISGLLYSGTILPMEGKSFKFSTSINIFFAKLLA